MTFIETVQSKKLTATYPRSIGTWAIARDLWPFLFAPAEQSEIDPTLAVDKATNNNALAQTIGPWCSFSL